MDRRAKANEDETERFEMAVETFSYPGRPSWTGTALIHWVTCPSFESIVLTLATSHKRYKAAFSVAFFDFITRWVKPRGSKTGAEMTAAISDQISDSNNL